MEERVLTAESYRLQLLKRFEDEGLKVIDREFKQSIGILLHRFEPALTIGVLTYVTLPTLEDAIGCRNYVVFSVGHLDKRDKYSWAAFCVPSWDKIYLRKLDGIVKGRRRAVKKKKPKTANITFRRSTGDRYLYENRIHELVEGR